MSLVCRSASGALIALVVLLGGAARASAPVELSFKVSPGAGTVADQYVATLQITMIGVGGAERFWPPDFGDFIVVDSRSQSSPQWVIDPRSGQQIKTVELRRYLLQPTRTGKLKIGEARVRVDGVEYRTKPVVVEVVAAGQPPPPDPTTATTDPDAIPEPDAKVIGNTFLHVVVDKHHVKVGEQITVSWFVYTRSEILRFSPTPPRLDAFWAETLFEPQNFLSYTQEEVKGRDYSVALVGKRALFATKPGTVTIPPYKASVGTIASDGLLQLASLPVKITVDPLPSGAPKGFDPAMIGNFEAEATLDRNEVPAGESLELNLTVRGDGALRRATIPPLSLDGFEVYAPRNYKESIDLSGDKVHGQRTYTYIITPKRGGKLTIGPLEIPFFNLTTDHWDAARTAAIQVKVIGDPVAPGAVDPRANDIAQDIRPPMDTGSLTPGPLDPRGGAFPWLMWALLLPPAVFAGALGVDALRARMKRDTPSARLRRARGATRTRARAARAHLEAGWADGFYKELGALLRERLEARLAAPVGALTRPVLKERLVASGLDEASATGVLRELDACDEARYAPGAAQAASMRAALSKALDMAGLLDQDMT
jgi:hypothetical protein